MSDINYDLIEEAIDSIETTNGEISINFKDNQTQEQLKEIKKLILEMHSSLQ